MAFSTLLGFLFLVSLAILDFHPTYHQENVGENIPKKRHFVHVNRIL